MIWNAQRLKSSTCYLKAVRSAASSAFNTLKRRPGPRRSLIPEAGDSLNRQTAPLHEASPHDKLQFRVDCPCGAGGCRVSACLLPVAQFEFHPATWHLSFDAVLALYAWSADQPANHQYHWRRSSGHLFPGPESDNGGTRAITGCSQTQGRINYHQGGPFYVLRNGCRSGKRCA